MLAAITADQVARAQSLIDAGGVLVSRTAAPEFIFCRVTIHGSDEKGEEHSAEVTLCGGPI
ncbi:serine dehydratase subunit alpha family protein, partial [Aeromonas hydrophila]